MIEGIPRISVLIVAYNQQELIKRAIDSLLNQADYLYEICVSDDCSTDDTWSVLQDYDLRYPGLFKLHRNDKNVGIFENVEYTWTMPTGDIVHQMAGDDECGEGWLKRVVDFIEEKNIDYKNELFCIYCDYIGKYPNGDTITIRNKHVNNYKKSLLPLAIRHIINHRGVCYSIKVLKKFQKVSQGRSHVAEEVMDRQLQFFSERNYYIHHVGNIYHIGVGVSSHIDDKTHEERQHLADYTISKASEIGIKFEEKEKYYMYFTQAMFQARYTHNISDYFLAIKLYVKSFSMDYGIKSFRLKRIYFAIRRRLPHKKPIMITV